MGVDLVFGVVPWPGRNLGLGEIETLGGSSQVNEGQAIAAGFAIESCSVTQNDREVDFVGDPQGRIRIRSTNVPRHRSLRSRHRATLMRCRGFPLAATSLESCELILPITLDFRIIGQGEVERGGPAPPSRPLCFAIGCRCFLGDLIAGHDQAMMKETRESFGLQCRKSKDSEDERKGRDHGLSIPFARGPHLPVPTPARLGVLDENANRVGTFALINDGR